MMTRARAGQPRQVALGLALAVLAVAPSALAGIDTPVPSGLAWRSGATGGGFPCLAQLRGRPLDAATVFITHDSFAAMVRQTGGAWARGTAKKAPLWVVSLPLLTLDTQGQFAQCAAGAFDGSFRQVGANLGAAAAEGAVVRLGWEASIGSAAHPWGVDHASQIPAYLGCWRHAAAALKQGGPAIKAEFNSAKRTSNPEFKSLDLYPGDSWVDGWSIQFYDRGPEFTTQAVWDKNYNLTMANGDLLGLGTWLAAAKAHGKTLSVAEWGVWQTSAMTAAQADDPVYVDNMYRFFKANAASIGYDTYFNADPDNGGHALCHGDGTPTAYPNAAAIYKADWASAK